MAALHLALGCCDCNLEGGFCRANAKGLGILIPSVRTDEDSRIEVLESRIEKLEESLKSTLTFIEQKVNFEFIDAATRVLGPKTLKSTSNYNYLGDRFKDYELMLLNVKQLGNVIGLLEAERHGGPAKVLNAVGPEIAPLRSKLCTQLDCDSSWYPFWLREMRYGFAYHRKLWEFCYIAQNLYSFGALADGKIGVGFGCGEEPLPSLFAKYGAASIATDLDPREFGEESQGWVETGQHGASLEALLKPEICADTEKLKLIGHQFVNMNNIPSEMTGKFDFCWSACALEHLGSIELGLSFIENSMDVLRPGGIAVHTTEYNLQGGETLDNCFTVLFQHQHMMELKARLESRGYFVEPFDLSGGGGVLDGLFDVPPWPWDAVKMQWQLMDMMSHLKRSVGGFACTSVGITVRKLL